MYSCHKERIEVVSKGSEEWPGFDSVHKCRFDKRYEPEHQKLGCETCTRPWDSEYLRNQGLLK